MGSSITVNPSATTTYTVTVTVTTAAYPREHLQLQYIHYQVSIDGDKDICGWRTVLTAVVVVIIHGAQETMATVSQSHKMRQPHIQ